jgi:hypothetical protein
VHILQRDADTVVVGPELSAGEQVVVSPVRSAVNGMRVESLPREALADESGAIAARAQDDAA